MTPGLPHFNTTRKNLLGGFPYIEIWKTLSKKYKRYLKNQLCLSNWWSIKWGVVSISIKIEKIIESIFSIQVINYCKFSK